MVQFRFGTDCTSHQGRCVLATSVSTIFCNIVIIVTWLLHQYRCILFWVTENKAHFLILILIKNFLNVFKLVPLFSLFRSLIFIFLTKVESLRLVGSSCGFDSIGSKASFNIYSIVKWK